MRILKDYMQYNYQINETDGPQYEEIMEIIQNVNEDEATSVIIKPKS